MSLFQLKSKFKPAGDQQSAIDILSGSIKKGNKNQTLVGVTGSGKTFTIANVIANIQKPTLIIAHNKTLAAQLCAEFKEFFPENAVEYFISYYDYYQPEAYIPQTDTYIDKDLSINEEIDRLRHSATKSLLTRKDVIVVASVSCIYGLGLPEEYFKALLHVKVSGYQEAKIDNFRTGVNLAGISVKTVISRQELIEGLVLMQYERNDFELRRGCFRVKGEVIDIYPVYQNEIIRIVFFDDDIENILELDAVSFEIISKNNEQYIFPAKHYLTAQDKLAAALTNISIELDFRIKELLAEGKTLEAHRIKQRTNYDLEMIREIGYCSGIENYSRHLEARVKGTPPAVLLDYFPQDFLVVIDESHITMPQIKGMYEGDKSRKKTLIDYGFRLPSALDNRPLNLEEFEKRVKQIVFMSATPKDYELEKSGQNIAEQIIRPTGLVDPQIVIKKSKGQIADLIIEIKKQVEKKERTLITTLTKRMSEDLTDYLAEKGIKVCYMHSDIDALDRIEIINNLRSGKFDVLVGINLLREGLDLPEVSLVAILDADKEGFLREARSLIQTIGRAARNINGRVIFYADSITKSMQYAIDETNRRREIQLNYNKKHNISPKTIIKTINFKEEKTYQILKDNKLHPEKIPHTIKELTEEMQQAASALEFEKAVVLRDQIKTLKKSLKKQKY